MSDIKAGLVYIRGNQLVLILLVVALATVLLAQPIRFFLPVLVVEAYNKESEAFGVLISVMGLGSLIGSLAIAAAGKGKRGLVLLTGSFVSAIALILVGLVPVYFAALGFMLLLGLGDSTRRALNHSLLLENSAEQYRGRVMSVLMMNFGLMPLGAVPAGFAIDLLGIRAVVGISGGLMIVTTAAVLLTQRRLRTLD
jgi:MFS family permease